MDMPRNKVIQALEGVITYEQLTAELAAMFPREAMRGVGTTRRKSLMSPHYVGKLVADEYGVDEQGIFGASRAARVTKARQVLMSLLARSDTLGLSLQDIGYVLGGRDHTTVIYGVDKVADDGIYKEPGYQNVLALMCGVLGVDYEEIKDVVPPRRSRNTGEADSGTLRQDV